MRSRVMARAMPRATSDEAAIAVMPGVVAVHRNTTSWYNNASFALPLLAAIVVGIVAAALRNRDVAAFAGFLLVVAVLMAPVVLMTWRTTPTVVVLSRDAITSLHDGRVLKSLRWDEVVTIARRETQGNVRWLVATSSGEHISLDGELENLDGLLAAGRRLAALPDQPDET